MKAIWKFIKDEDGLTTVEYAVAGAMIALAVVAMFGTLGQTVLARITSINAAL